MGCWDRAPKPYCKCTTHTDHRTKQRRGRRQQSLSGQLGPVRQGPAAGRGLAGGRLQPTPSEWTVSLIHSMSGPWQVPGPFFTPSANTRSAARYEYESIFQRLAWRAGIRLYFGLAKFPSFMPSRCVASFRYWGLEIAHNLQYSFLQASGCYFKKPSDGTDGG